MEEPQFAPLCMDKALRIERPESATRLGGQNWPRVVPRLASRFGALNLLLTGPTQSRISAYT